MSRSYKKQPFVSITPADSEKFDKILFHRRMRHEERRRLQETKKSGEFDDHLTTLPEAVSDPWMWAKDGRQLTDDPTDLRK